MTADTTLASCGECGMPCNPAEYHPYAACLMFKACRNSETVRANLNAVRAQAPAPQGPQSEVELKAARWDYLCRHWSLLTTKHNKDGTLKTVVLTLNANARGRAGSPRLDGVIGQAIAEEASSDITGAPNGKPT